MTLVTLTASFLVEDGLLKGACAPLIETELDLDRMSVCINIAEGGHELTTVKMAARVTSEMGLK